MRENFRAEVRQIAGAVASDTIMRYADAIARSPYAQQAMDEASRRVATEVAGAIAGERVAQAEEIIRSADAKAKDTAARTAQQVAERAAADVGVETAAKALAQAHEAVEEALGRERWELTEKLAGERRELLAMLDRARADVTGTLEKERTAAGELLRKEQASIGELLERQRTATTEMLEQQRTATTQLLDKHRTGVVETVERQQADLVETVERHRVDVTESVERQRAEVSAELGGARAEISASLAGVRGEVDDVLGSARDALREARAEATRAIGAFAREEAARAVAAVVADTVPPVVEVRVATADPVRVTGHTHVVLPDVLLALGAGCHVLLVGPAGTGKSMMAQQAAEAFGQEFHALSLGPTTPMSKIFGYYDANGHYHATPFRRAFEHGGLMLLDELDSGHPGLLAELNQALSIRSCAFADGMVAAHPDFRLIATANTYGTGGDRQYVGRQALDAATLDRFVVVDVPVDEELEERIALAHAPQRAAEARKVIEEVRRLRATAAEKRLPVMFSPRASIDAARLLQAGASVAQALRWRVVRGMSAAHRSALGIPDGTEPGGDATATGKAGGAGGAGKAGSTGKAGGAGAPGRARAGAATGGAGAGGRARAGGK